MPTVYARDGEKFYRLTVSRRWYSQNNNYMMVSVGLTVGIDLKKTQLEALIKQKKAVEVDKDTWNHAGCQSSCVLRGGAECRW